ncbi:MAG: TRAP transporter small permease [Desulfobacterota bacterium]|nr:TRAP transporter small permease [Thermodesulfobacteriota bacterium]MDW8002591.1 TRAP transporter small permease [Deltaproteobacteria bacterium]
MGLFERGTVIVSKFFDFAARLGVFVMMALVVTDIIIRRPLWPIPGLYDYVSLLGAAIISLAIPFSAVQKGHVQVEIFVSKLPSRAQAAIDAIMGILSLVFFVIVSWQTFVLGTEVKRSGEVSMSAHLEFYPFIYLVSVMCALLCVVLIVDVIKSAKKLSR